MNSPLHCGIFVLLYSLKLVSACLDGNCRTLAFPAPFFFDHKRLVYHTLRTEDGVDFDVSELLCYHEVNCVSINYDLNTRRCELNNATHRGHDNEFVEKIDYLYHGADSACDEFPCKNDGTCQSGFTDKRYRCLCPPGFTGAQCEEDINECTKKTYNCGKNARCENNQGSYTCICNSGYFGDGRTCSVPDSVAFFPLNVTYGTKEVNNRTDPGIPSGVSFVSGPDGKANGSYEFYESSKSYIEIHNSAGGTLDLRYSITLLCWLFYDGKGRHIFTYGTNGRQGLSLGVLSEKISVRFVKRNNVLIRDINSLQPILVGEWIFVAASYDYNSGEAKLWLDGLPDVSEMNIGAGSELTTQDNVKMGLNIKGRITQMQVYNTALTQEQIQTIKNRTQPAEVSANSSILSVYASYPSQLDIFLEPVVGKDPEWFLCYCASLHGWDVRSFHRRCDGKSNTVTIIRKDEYVFGGYTDIPWDSDSGYAYSFKAFIFSLRANEGLAPFKSLVKKPSRATYRASSYGPTFGEGHDIYIANHANTNSDSHSYFGYSYYLPSGVQGQPPILAGTYMFSPDEVEVFYLDPSH